jgi:ribosome-associated protein
MTLEGTGAQARPEPTGFSTIVHLTDMPSTNTPIDGTVHALVLHQLDEDQAQDVVSIPLEGKSSIADYMVIASGRSTRQVAAMAMKLAERLKKEGHGTPRIEGLPAADWVLIDAGDVVVHLFRPEVRSFYSLERMWGFGDEGAAVTGRA